MLVSRKADLDSHQFLANNNLYSFKELLLLLVMWLVTGIFLGLLSIPVLALLILYLHNKGRFLYLFIAFFFTLILSDSRIYALSFAQDLKTVLMVFLFIPLVIPHRVSLDVQLNQSLGKSFLPFIAFAFFCIIFSPEPFTAFQKTLSYFLLFLIVPVLFYSLYKAHSINFLKALIYLGSLVLIAGYVMYLVNPLWVMYAGGGRSSGALGNPNGLGMFSFLFFLLYFVIKHYFPDITSRRLHIIIYALVFSSLIWSGSRGQTLAVLIFLVTQFLSHRNKTVGLLLAGIISIMLVTVEVDIVAIANMVGAQDFLRVDTFEQAGGRVVAREFAWEQIENNFWVGRGFSYTEWIYRQHFWELSMRGHEGNAHNAFLTIWLDTGLIGLILFATGWGVLFLKAAKNSFLALPVALSLFASNMVESWLAASLNPFTIQVVMILTILIFIVRNETVCDLQDLSNQKDSNPRPAFR